MYKVFIYYDWNIYIGYRNVFFYLIEVHAQFSIKYYLYLAANSCSSVIGNHILCIKNGFGLCTH